MNIIRSHQSGYSTQPDGYLIGREWEGIHKPVVTKLNDILYFNTMENGLEELLRFSRPECDGTWQGSTASFFK